MESRTGVFDTKTIPAAFRQKDAESKSIVLKRKTAVSKNDVRLSKEWRQPFQKNGVSLSKRMALAFPKEWRQPFLVISLFRGMDAHIRMPAINISQKPISREP